MVSRGGGGLNRDRTREKKRQAKSTLVAHCPKNILENGLRGSTCPLVFLLLIIMIIIVCITM